MKNYITLEQAKNIGLDWNEYNTNRMNEEIQSLENFKDLCKIVPMVYISNYDDKVHFEHIKVFIEYKGILLSPFKYYNEKTFKFYLANSLNVNSFYTKLVEPSKVGKPTEKKLDNWLEYLQEIERQKTEKVSERSTKEKEFFDKIKASGLKVTHQSQNGKSGYIETEYFDFSFEVESDGHIRQKITMRKSPSIDVFLEMIKK
jgi:hypothetical protein